MNDQTSTAAPCHPRTVRVAELQRLAGTSLGPTDWLHVSQERISAFADATDDHQWIHIDPVRAAKEGPGGTTIAHGFLTLSLISALFERLLVIEDAEMIFNYGAGRVRFPAPVPAGSSVRAWDDIGTIQEKAGGCLLITHVVTLERDAGEKPACVAEILTMVVPPSS